ncbi:hypothetical protein V6N13_143649 [Hibiscus sabdariffa]
MYSTVVSSVYAVCSDAAGVAGNIFAFVLFLSPIPTFRRIIRNGSTEQFSGMFHIYAFLNCLICLWYGMPLVSPANEGTKWNWNGFGDSPIGLVCLFWRCFPRGVEASLDSSAHA